MYRTDVSCRSGLASWRRGGPAAPSYRSCASLPQLTTACGPESHIYFLHYLFENVGNVGEPLAQLLGEELARAPTDRRAANLIVRAVGSLSNVSPDDFQQLLHRLDLNVDARVLLAVLFARSELSSVQSIGAPAQREPLPALTRTAAAAVQVERCWPRTCRSAQPTPIACPSRPAPHLPNTRITRRLCRFLPLSSI